MQKSAISILIPIYNRSVVKLVNSLYKQCTALDLDFEILCFDDQSKDNYKEKNIVLGDLYGVNYTELSEKLGRSKIRNWLAKCARYENLIFLDCDAKIISKNYIQNYIKSFQENTIISGGSTYTKKKPTAASKILHWSYGTKKEAVSADKRNQNSIQYFHTINISAPRQMIIDHPFESIKGYGYEDILLAKNLQEAGFQIKHIDNPVEHLGIKSNKQFILGLEESIDTLKHLHQQDIHLGTRLEKWAKYLYAYDVDSFYTWFIQKWEHKLTTNLMSNKPKILYISLYKLYLLLKK